MSSILWKVKAIKSWSVVTKGMEVDIVVQNRSGKPHIRDIAQALTENMELKICLAQDCRNPPLSL